MPDPIYRDRVTYRTGAPLPGADPSPGLFQVNAASAGTPDHWQVNAAGSLTPDYFQVTAL